MKKSWQLHLWLFCHKIMHNVMMEMINVLSWAFFNSLHLNFLGTCGTFNKTLFNMRTTIHKWGIGEKHNYRRAVLQTLTPWSNWKPPRGVQRRSCLKMPSFHEKNPFPGISWNLPFLYQSQLCEPDRKVKLGRWGSQREAFAATPTTIGHSYLKDWSKLFRIMHI